MNANTMSCWSSLLVLLLLVAGQHHLANAMKSCQDKVNLFRLPQRVQPRNYRLYLKLNPEEAAFSGRVEIDLNIQAMDSDEFLLSRTIGEKVPDIALDQRNIILNAEKLEVFQPKFHQDGHSLDVADICHDADSKILVVTLNMAPSLEVDAILTLSFEGQVESEAKGLFRSSLESSQTLFTNLRPAYARRLFPCFDEPEFKATFELTIRHPYRTTALSSMPIISSRSSGGDHVITRYEGTLKMSTYLLSLAVGKFKSIHTFSVRDGTEIFIYTPKGRTKSSKLMLKKAVQAYDRVSSFFAQLPQPLRKINIVAVSNYLGPMGNGGLITMSWDLLLTGEQLAKPEDLNYAITALTSEMIRIWLGNLVTMRWWDDLWLIEGLASYLASELTAELHPMISSELYTVIDTTISALNDEDDNRNPRPIKDVKLNKADQILASYDSTTYKKSEAVFRMFANFLGKEMFNLAVYKFVEEHKWNLVEADDWWVMLKQHTIPQYHNMVDSAYKWIEQAGYPVIVVSYVGVGKLSVMQKSSLLNGQIWSVPISYEFMYTSSGVCFGSDKFVLSQSDSFEHDLPLNLNFLLRKDWIKFNPTHHGYYRMIYNYPAVANALVRAFKRPEFLPSNQLQLLSDFYYNGKRNGAMRHFAELLAILSGEEHDGVILLLTRVLTDLHKDTNMSQELKSMVKSVMMKYHRKTGRFSSSTSSNVLTQYTRGRVLDYLVNILNVPSIIDEAWGYMMLEGESPPFFKHVLENLPLRNQSFTS